MLTFPSSIKEKPRLISEKVCIFFYDLHISRCSRLNTKMDWPFLNIEFNTQAPCILKRNNKHFTMDFTEKKTKSPLSRKKRLPIVKVHRNKQKRIFLNFISLRDCTILGWQHRSGLSLRWILWNLNLFFKECATLQKKQLVFCEDLYSEKTLKYYGHAYYGAYMPIFKDIFIFGLKVCLKWGQNLAIVFKGVRS